nr:MAG: polyprotein [Bamboo rat pestivirus]
MSVATNMQFEEFKKMSSPHDIIIEETDKFIKNIYGEKYPSINCMRLEIREKGIIRERYLESKMTTRHPHEVKLEIGTKRYLGSDPKFGECPTTNGVFLTRTGARFNKPLKGVWRIRLPVLDLKPSLWYPKNGQIPNYVIMTTSQEECQVFLEGEKIFCTVGYANYRWCPEDDIPIYVKTTSDWAQEVEDQEKLKPKPQRVKKADPRTKLKQGPVTEQEITEKKKPPDVTLVYEGRKYQIRDKGRTKSKNTKDGLYEINKGKKKEQIDQLKKALHNWHITALTMVFLFSLVVNLVSRQVEGQEIVQWNLKDNGSTNIHKAMYNRQMNRSLHGIWPENICKGLPNVSVSEEQFRKIGMMDSSPETNYTCCHLQYHEWKKHGWCNNPNQIVWLNNMTNWQMKLNNNSHEQECAIQCRHDSVSDLNIVLQARNQPGPMTGCKEGKNYSFSGENRDSICRKNIVTNTIILDVKLENRVPKLETLARGMEKILDGTRRAFSKVLGFLETVGQIIPKVEALEVYCKNYTVRGLYIHVNNCLPKGLPKEAQILSYNLIYLGQQDPLLNLHHFMKSSLDKWLLLLLGLLSEINGELASFTYLMLEYGIEYLDHEKIQTENLTEDINITRELKASDTVPGWVWVAGQWNCVKPNWWPGGSAIEEIFMDLYYVIKIFIAIVEGIFKTFKTMNLVFLTIVLYKIVKGKIVQAILWLMLLGSTEAKCVPAYNPFANEGVSIDGTTGKQKNNDLVQKYMVVQHRGWMEVMEKKTIIQGNTTKTCYNDTTLDVESWEKQPNYRKSCGQEFPWWSGDLKAGWLKYEYWWVNTGKENCTLRPGIIITKHGKIKCHRNGQLLSLDLLEGEDNLNISAIPCSPIKEKSMGEPESGRCVYEWAPRVKGWAYDDKDPYWQQYVVKGDHQYWTVMSGTRSAYPHIKHIMPLIVAILLGGKISVWLMVMWLVYSAEANEVGAKTLSCVLTVYYMDTFELILYIVFIYIVQEEIIRKIISMLIIIIKTKPTYIIFLVTLHLVGGAEALNIEAVLNYVVEQPTWDSQILGMLVTYFRYIFLTFCILLHSDSCIKYVYKLLFFIHILILTYLGTVDVFSYRILFISNVLYKLVLYFLAKTLNYIEKKKYDDYGLVLKMFNYKRKGYHKVSREEGKELLKSKEVTKLNKDFIEINITWLQIFRAIVTSLCFSIYKPLICLETFLNCLLTILLENRKSVVRGRTMAQELIALSYAILPKINGSGMKDILTTLITGNEFKVMKHTIKNRVLKKYWQSDSEVFNSGLRQLCKVEVEKKITLENVVEGTCGMPFGTKQLPVIAKKNNCVMTGDYGLSLKIFEEEQWKVLGPGCVPRVSRVTENKFSKIEKLEAFLGVEPTKIPRSPISNTMKLYRIQRGFNQGWAYTTQTGVSSDYHVTGEKNLMVCTDAGKGKFVLQSSSQEKDETEYGMKSDSTIGEQVLCYSFNPEAMNIKGETGAVIFLKKINNAWTIVTEEGNQAYYSVDTLKGWSGLPIFTVSTSQLVGRIKSAKVNEENLAEVLIDNKRLDKAVDGDLQSTVFFIKNMKDGGFKNVTLGTGAGKSTELPKEVLLTIGPSKAILVLMPLRAPAESVCAYMSRKYPQIKFSLRVGEHKEGDCHTGVTYATYGYICQMTTVSMKQFLLNFKYIFLDEYHVASPEQISVISKLFKNRPDHLRVVAMSATPPGTVSSTGRKFDIEEIGTATVDKGKECKKNRFNCAGLQIPIEEKSRNNLVFVASKDEADEIAYHLQTEEGVNAISFYSGKDPKILEQQMATQPYTVVATNAIESGITCPDLDNVIDTMLKYEKIAELNSCLPCISTRLVKKRITIEEQGQRKGRVGRQKRGKYYYPCGCAPSGSKDINYSIIQSQYYGLIEQINITEEFQQMNEEWGLYEVNEVDLQIMSILNKTILTPLTVVENQILQRSTHPEKIELMYNRLLNTVPLVFPETKDGQATNNYITYNLSQTTKVRTENPSMVYVMQQEETAMTALGLEIEPAPTNVPPALAACLDEIEKYTHLSGTVEKLLVGAMAGYLGYKYLSRHHIPWVKTTYEYEIVPVEDTYEYMYPPSEVITDSPKMKTRNRKETKKEDLNANEILKKLRLAKEYVKDNYKSIMPWVDNNQNYLDWWEKLKKYLDESGSELAQVAGWGIHTVLHDSVKARMGDEVATAVMILKYVAFGSIDIPNMIRQVAIDTVIYYITNTPKFEGDEEAKKKGKKLIIELLISNLCLYAYKVGFNFSVETLKGLLTPYFPTFSKLVEMVRPNFFEGTLSMATTVYRIFLSVKTGKNQGLITQFLSTGVEILSMNPISILCGLVMGLSLAVLHTLLENSDNKKNLLIKLAIKNFVDQSALDEIEKLETSKIIFSILEGFSICANPLRIVALVYLVYYKKMSHGEALQMMSGKSLILLIINEGLQILGYSDDNIVQFNGSILDKILNKLTSIFGLISKNIQQKIRPSIPFIYCKNWKSDPRVQGPENFDEVVVECQCGAWKRYVKDDSGIHPVEGNTGGCRNFLLWEPNFQYPDPSSYKFKFCGQIVKGKVMIFGDDIIYGRWGKFIRLRVKDKTHIITHTSHATISNHDLKSILTNPDYMKVGKVEFTEVKMDRDLIERKLVVKNGDQNCFWKCKKGFYVSDNLRTDWILNTNKRKEEIINWDLYQGGTHQVLHYNIRVCSPLKPYREMVCSLSHTARGGYQINGYKNWIFQKEKFNFECHHDEDISLGDEMIPEMEELEEPKLPCLSLDMKYPIDNISKDFNVMSEEEMFLILIKIMKKGIILGAPSQDLLSKVEKTGVELVVLTDEPVPFHPAVKQVKSEAEVYITMDLGSLAVVTEREATQEEFKEKDYWTDDNGQAGALVMEDQEMPELEQITDDDEGWSTVTTEEEDDPKIELNIITRDGVKTYYIENESQINEHVVLPYTVVKKTEKNIQIKVEYNKIRELVGSKEKGNLMLTALIKEAMSNLEPSLEKFKSLSYPAEIIARGNLKPVSPVQVRDGKIVCTREKITAWEALSIIRTEKQIKKLDICQVDLRKYEHLFKISNLQNTSLNLINSVKVGKVAGRDLQRVETNVPNKEICRVLTTTGIDLNKLPVVRAVTEKSRFHTSILEKIDKSENRQRGDAHDLMWAAFEATAKVEFKNKLDEIPKDLLETNINRQGAVGFFEKFKNVGDIIDNYWQEVERTVEKIKTGKHIYYETAMPKNEKRDVLGDWMEDDFVTEKKPRVIQYPDAVTRLAIIKVMYGWVKQQPLLIPGYEGKTPIFEIFNKVKKDWDSYQRPAAICFDTKAWDTQVTSRDLELVARIHKYYYKKRNHEFINNLCNYMKKPLVVTVDGEMFIRNGQRGSGQPDTSAGNSMLNYLTMMVTVHLCTGVPIRAVHKMVSIHICGDDGFLITELGIAEKIRDNGLIILQELGKPQKLTEGSRMKMVIQFDELEFCSHKPIKVRIKNKGEIWMPARDTSVILGKMSTKLSQSSTRMGLDYEKQVAFSFLLLYPWNPYVRRLCLYILSLGKTIREIRDQNIIYHYQGDPIGAFQQVWGFQPNEIEFVHPQDLAKFNYSMSWLGAWKRKSTEKINNLCLELGKNGRNLPILADRLVSRKLGKVYEPGLGSILLIRPWEELTFKKFIFKREDDYNLIRKFLKFLSHFGRLKFEKFL